MYNEVATNPVGRMQSDTRDRQDAQKVLRKNRGKKKTKGFSSPVSISKALAECPA